MLDTGPRDPSPKPVENPKTLSLQDKLSVWGLVVISVGSILVLAAMGLLFYLWFADASNPTWKDLVLQDWLTRAVAINAEFPAFAEYCEPPYEAEGIRDTGLTLRAFLPFPTAQERQTMTSYSGRTTVMDSRVTCQIPNLQGHRVQMIGDLEQFLVVEGTVAASRSTPRLGNRTTILSGSRGAYNLPIPFSCLAPVGPFHGP